MKKYFIKIDPTVTQYKYYVTDWYDTKWYFVARTRKECEDWIEEHNNVLRKESQS